MGFPDSACDPHILADLLLRIDPKHPGVYRASHDFAIPVITYSATPELCAKIASDFENVSDGALKAHIKRCRGSRWYSPKMMDEEIAQWFRKDIPRYLRRLKYGWKCLS